MKCYNLFFNPLIEMPLLQKGFTVIELVLVMLIIGLASTVVSLPWPANSINLQAQALQVLNDIRYAQAQSITTGQRYRWVKTSASSYQILNQSGTALRFSSGATQVNLASNVSFGTFSNLPNNLIAFDSAGMPYSDATQPGTALSSTATINIVAGSSSQSIQINAQTGFAALT